MKRVVVTAVCATGLSITNIFFRLDTRRRHIDGGLKFRVSSRAHDCDLQTGISYSRLLRRRDFSKPRSLSLFRPPRAPTRVVCRERRFFGLLHRNGISQSRLVTARSTAEISTRRCCYSGEMDVSARHFRGVALAKLANSIPIGCGSDLCAYLRLLSRFGEFVEARFAAGRPLTV